MESTNSSGPTSAGENPIQEISGQSLFWALVTLALAATMSRKRHRGGLDFRRSLPVYCLIDGIHNTITLLRISFIRLPKDSSIGRATAERSSSPAVTSTEESTPQSLSVEGQFTLAKLKTVLFIHSFGLLPLSPRSNEPEQSLPIGPIVGFLLGVLPQTVKVLSMHGIPFTKLCVVCYLFKIISEAMVSMLGIGDQATDPILTLNIGLFLWAFSLSQMIISLWITLDVSRRTHFTLSATSADVLLLISLVNNTCLMGLGMMAFYRRILRRDRIFPPTIMTFAKYSYAFTLLSSNFESHRSSATYNTGNWKDCARHWSKRTNQWWGLTMAVWVLSLFVARILVYLQRAFKSFRHGSVSSPSPHQSGERNDSHVAQPSDGFTTVTQLSPSSSMPISHSTSHGGGHEDWETGSLAFKLLIVMLQFEKLGVLLSPTDEQNLVIGIFNLISTILYYLVYFDSSGTWCPTWTSYLG